MRVAVLEDQMLTRQGIVHTLEDANIEVVAAVGEVPALFQAIALDGADAALLDVRLPPTYTTEGIDAAIRIRRDYPDTSVLVLSQYVEFEYAAALLTAASGGMGYLLKERVLEPSTLVDSLRRVVAGECVVDPGIVAELMRAHTKSAALSVLTERELEVLAAIAEGLTNSGIARRLVLSDRTVEVHSQHVFTKLGIAMDADSNRRVLAALVYLREQD